MQVKRSPMALCTSNAATAESTPPLKAHSACAWPICCAISLTAVSNECGHRPVAAAAAGLCQEILEDPAPVVRVDDLRMKLKPPGKMGGAPAWRTRSHRNEPGRRNLPAEPRPGLRGSSIPGRPPEARRKGHAARGPRLWLSQIPAGRPARPFRRASWRAAASRSRCPGSGCRVERNLRAGRGCRAGRRSPGLRRESRRAAAATGPSPWLRSRGLSRSTPRARAPGGQ